MVKATKGILVNWYSVWHELDNHRITFDSDGAVKELLLQLDSSMHFIIEVLDSNHLFIEETQYERVQEMLQEKLSENVFKVPE